LRRTIHFCDSLKLTSVPLPGGSTLVVPLTEPTADDPPVELDHEARETLKLLRSQFDRMINMKTEE
jgi:hypothetical protein